MTDQQQQQKVNEAAEKFTDALVQSYKVVAERGASTQEQNAQLTSKSELQKLVPLSLGSGL